MTFVSVFEKGLRMVYGRMVYGKNEHFSMIFRQLSAFYVCCIYSSALQTRFLMEANNMKPDQTVPRQQSDFGPKVFKKTKRERRRMS